MTCQVWIQPRADRGYLATTLGWPRCEAQGTTREEALRNVQATVEDLLAKGEIVTLEVNPPRTRPMEQPNPWLERAGLFRDDPHWDEFQEAIADYRREVDARERANE
jgi:predicted RNase H-like HicB family nuclease